MAAMLGQFRSASVVGGVALIFHYVCGSMDVTVCFFVCDPQCACKSFTLLIVYMYVWVS